MFTEYTITKRALTKSKLLLQADHTICASAVLQLLILRVRGIHTQNF